MKTTKWIYWISTGIISLMMLYSAYAYLTQDEIKMGFQHLGFPSYFRVELALAKFLAAAVLILPVHLRIKEWAYAGLSITFVSAFIAHMASGDPVNYWMMPLVMLSILAASYFSFHRYLQTTSPLSAQPA